MVIIERDRKPFEDTTWPKDGLARSVTVDPRHDAAARAGRLDNEFRLLNRHDAIRGILVRAAVAHPCEQIFEWLH